MHKIKWWLFLNPFDRITPNIIKTKLQKLKHSESGSVFSSLKGFSNFDWIQIIVALAGALRNTMEPEASLENEVTSLDKSL